MKNILVFLFIFNAGCIASADNGFVENEKKPTEREVDRTYTAPKVEVEQGSDSFLDSPTDPQSDHPEDFGANDTVPELTLGVLKQVRKPIPNPNTQPVK